jgi:hypothetical protein
MDPLSEHDLAAAKPERVLELQTAMLAALRTYEDVQLENGFLFYSNPTP